MIVKNICHIALAAPFVLGIFAAHTAQAATSIEICNNGSVPVHVARVHSEDGWGRTWVGSGWYKIAPNRCQYLGNRGFPGDYFFGFRLTRPDGSKGYTLFSPGAFSHGTFQSSKRVFCVRPDEKFDYHVKKLNQASDCQEKGWAIMPFSLHIIASSNANIKFKVSPDSRTKSLAFQVYGEKPTQSKKTANGGDKVRARPKPKPIKRTAKALKASRECEALAAWKHEPYKQGKGVDIKRMDIAAAMNACSLAVADAGTTAKDLYRLGRVHYAKKDYAQARKFFLRAANANYAPGEYGLGLLYYEGQGVTRNYTTAYTWFSKAKKRYFYPSYIYLGLIFEFGLGVKKNHQIAHNYYLHSGSNGLDFGQHYLARSYQLGIGTKKDFIKARKEYTKAAKQGLKSSQYELGLSFFKGEGGKQDLKQAKIWLQNAADQGYAKAVQFLNKHRKELE